MKKLFEMKLTISFKALNDGKNAIESYHGSKAEFTKRLNSKLL